MRGWPARRCDAWVARVTGLLVALALLLFFFAAEAAQAGGPRWVAGPSYFDPAAMGQPVVWSGGQVSYYTDLSDLSAEVSQSQANAMVATAAAVWNGVATAAVSITRGGNLAESVDAAIAEDANGGITLPEDVQPTATNRPVAVVYDANGSVIDGIYGAGASSTLACQNNGVFAEADNFAATGNLVHAVILVNGLCATTADQITMLQYQLARAFGYVLGLGWSQANEAMFVGYQTTSAGLAGWPVMHPMERICGPEGGDCMPDPLQLRTDDVAALNRLYSVTAANIGNFKGKTLTAAATISVRGTIRFPLGQGMQGVNVVLRPVVNGVPDLAHTATAVSGEYFSGNAGNPVTGTTDAAGNVLTMFGSDDATLEGYYDLSDVPLPPGVTASDYELSFEPVNPLYTGSLAVGPYSTGQVTPSGTLPTVTLTGLSAGASVTQDVTVEDAADEALSGADGSEGSPANVPASGEWTARLTGYGHTAWFQWWAKANREFTVEAQALDEQGAATENKAEVVIGAWNGTDAAGTPPVTGTAQPFNGEVAGLTTLPVMTVASSEVRIGLTDFRGDGRPDYAYRGRVLYADSVTPSRLPASGGQIAIRGMGFESTCGVTVNGQAAQVTSVTPNTIVATAPPSGGTTGVVLVAVQDAETLGVTAIADGLSYEADGTDALSIMAAPQGAVPLGVPQAFTVKALDVASQTPTAGVTVTFTVMEGATALGCGQGICSATTGEDGQATMTVTANSTAPAQVTASLTNGSSVIAEFTGAAPPSILALTPNLYLAMGVTAQWPAQAMVLSPGGTPMAGQSVAWTAGGAGVTVGTCDNTSGAGGMVSDQIAAGPFSESVAVTASACLAGTTQCANFTVTPVHPQNAALTAVSGTEQYVAASQGFSPVTLRATDGFGHPLAGATVSIAETLYAWTQPCTGQGECPPAPVLGEQIADAASGIDGTVTFTPLAANGAAARLMITAATGGTAMNFELDAHP